MAKNSPAVFKYPEGAERDYVKALLAYTKSLRAASEKTLAPMIGRLALSYQAQYRGDDWLDELEAAIAQLNTAASIGADALIGKLLAQFERVSGFNEQEFRRVVKAETGLTVPPAIPGVISSFFTVSSIFRSESFLVPLANAWIRENTSLIKSLPTTLHKDLEGIIRRGVMSGESVAAIKSNIKQKYNVSDYRAKLIAQDQTLKLNSDLTEFRLKSVGVKSYEWETSNDSRVRDSHADRSGKIYAWNKPPAGGKHPGQEIRCRCRARAIFPEFK